MFLSSQNVVVDDQNVGDGTVKYLKIIQGAPTLKKGIQLRVKRIINDSRCPEEVQCIWAGEVSVEIIIYKDKKVIELKTLTINSKNSEENTGWFQQYYKIKIKKIGVFPSLKTGVLINPKSYYMMVYY